MDRHASPYKGLAYYEESDKDLFAGRDEAIATCIALIRHSSTSLFVLHGLSGCGKSSFIRAGLIPRLKARTESTSIVPLVVVAPLHVAPNSQGCLFGVAAAIHDIAVVLQNEGCEAEGVVNIVGTPRADFAAAYENDAETLYRKLIDITLATPRLPVLILDQAEDIVRAHAQGKMDATPFFRLMARLCTQRVDVRICIAMRSEYKAQFDDYTSGAKPFSVAGYYLPQMSREHILEAIERPTKMKKASWPKFEISNAAVGKLLDKVSKEGVMGGPLIAAQLMCQRLYRYATDEARRREIRGQIRVEDVLALGEPNDQIIFHLQESLYEAFDLAAVPGKGVKAKEYGPSRAVRADAWLDRLCMLVVSAPDGRASSGSQRFPVLKPKNEDDGGARAIIAHLCDVEEYILLREEGDQYCLRHDSLALALRRWQEGDRIEGSPGEINRRAVVSAACYGIDPLELLWTDEYPKPSVLTLSTLDDTIWDHLLLAFADKCGFAKRLGINLVQRKRFLWRSPGQPDDELYWAFLESRGPRIAILPLEIMPVPKSWRHIAITNVFRGYAVTGRTIELTEHADIRAFDPFCRRFGQLLLPLLLNRPPKVLKFSADGHENDGDAFYQWLISHPNRFGIGPAPTRARWRQTGEFREWDTNTEQDKLTQHPEIARQISALSMHEVCAIFGVSDPAWHYRIAALVFYAVEFLLRNPAEFIRYLFDYEWDLRRGRMPVSRDAIQETVSASYHHALFESYAHAYLNPLSEDYIRGTQRSRVDCRNDIRLFYAGLLEFRKEYDDMLLQLHKRSGLAHDQVGRGLVQAAARHYKIYNFYDAKLLLGKALRRLEGQ